ncbi:30S ribosomal protein S20 [Thermosulfuriphilus ammonigenes]|uniref:Small ribosomal subunit protein bS20 n=1 Tax=Thermosulfuriphilus ammonigenes TaxID=1936021 RepID=A0A6G7PTD5_9BACT|nr:30S ribosomal protein S20 [Thermosulfuriphilus ammonigenes]MBA2848940.1 small subunit ribosomal protein S20 [Thermosulfuriphilus ammonigenes]QIJ70945.1 30S ribosomal protein S20 [Thermosulfuriphilus ammonigenes]HFB83625.1 30S ribosomal protein S20 [Thermodesulfatator sp.]
MANHPSAKKRARQSEKRRLRNKAIRTRVKNVSKAVLAAVNKGSVEEAEAAFRKAQSTIQWAVSKGVLHWKKAGRKISRLAAKVNNLKATKQQAA